MYFTKGKSSDEMTVLVDQWRAVDTVCLDFSKVFDNVTHKILTDKCLVHRMNRQAVRWTENFLEGQAKRVVVISLH